jgi:hypothetical protein
MGYLKIIKFVFSGFLNALLKMAYRLREGIAYEFKKLPYTSFLVICVTREKDRGKI